MSPFKEPQPRKKAPGASEPGVNPWPPYVREVGQANWSEVVAEEVAQVVTAEDHDAAHAKAKEVLEEWKNTPLMVIPDYSPFELRKAALEAALTHARNMNLDNSAQGVTVIADIFENYLKNGKPS